MSFFIDLSKDDFLKKYWQQSPYIFRQALPEFTGVVDGDDLAGLACEEDAESRVLKGAEIDGDWSCDIGPFDESYFSTLPEKNWTLLVQGLDQWSEEVAEILMAFDFLPSWRLEDIMASYAPLGGSVGPHFDYYDVFLLQVSGSREWRLGQQCNQETVLQPNDSVKLLPEFLTEQTAVLDEGDMLYIPAGKAHWGVASTDDCITLSIGFRAPSDKEILERALEQIVDQLPEHLRYQDSLSSIDANPAKINESAQQQLQRCLNHLDNGVIQQAVASAFGELVTEPRYQHNELPESELSIADLQGLLKSEGELLIEASVSTRLAFSDKQLFVNGECYSVSESFAESLIGGRLTQISTEKEWNILLDLINQGDVIVFE